MEALLEKFDCADMSSLIQFIFSALDEDLYDLQYMIESDRYSPTEISDKITEIRRMIY